MPEQTTIIVNGFGKMGKIVAETVAQNPGLNLWAIIDPGYHQGNFEVAGKTNIIVGASFDRLVTDGIDKAVIIDFSTPGGTRAALKFALENGMPLVIGTTGIESGSPLMEDISSAAKKIPIVFSPNMSIGVNLLFSLLPQITKLLGDSYDTEIIEAHHRLKRDAPSGTALKIAQVLCEATGRNLENDVRYGRQGLIGERTKSEIGMHAIRGGSIVGDHTILFAGPGECIEISHRALSRQVFAQGAARAALFLAEQKEPGLFTMMDVLAGGGMGAASKSRLVLNS